MSENIYKEYKIPETGGGLYHKFEDGVTYIVRLASEPVVYNTEFQTPTGETNISTKYAWVIWNVEEKIAQILQLPVTGYRQIAAFASDDEYGDPTQYNFKITRTGKGLETKYSVVASPNKTKLAEVDENAPNETASIDLKAKVEAGKGVMSVMWLSDAMKDPKEQAKADTKTFNDAAYGKADTDNDQAPVDLSEIPF